MLARDDRRAEGGGAAGGHPRYKEYPDLKHDSYPSAYAEPEFLPWMFAQRRGKVAP
ncbi:MAG: hypothetical protein WDN28_10085 [Chthoniobacter sp.]